MKIGRRQGTFAFTWLLIAGVTAAGFALHFSQPDHLLLSVAKRVVGADCSQDACRAITECKVVSVDQPDWINAHNVPEWRLSNTKTGHVDIRSLPNCPYGTHTGIDTSPDGSKVLCYSSSPNDRPASLVDMQTGRFSLWTPSDDVYHYPVLWMPDSRRWLSLATVPQGFVTVYHAETPNAPDRIPFPEFRSAVWKDFEVAGQDRLYVTESFCSDKSGRSATFTEYRLGAQVERIALHVVQPPFDVESYRFTISPRDDRIAWTCTERRQPGFAQLLHRILPHWSVPMNEIVSLWTSDLDGKDWREIGHISSTVGENASLGFAWLPNGRQISFVHEGVLYIVADGTQQPGEVN